MGSGIIDVDVAALGWPNNEVLHVVCFDPRNNRPDKFPCQNKIKARQNMAGLRSCKLEIGDSPSITRGSSSAKMFRCVHARQRISQSRRKYVRKCAQPRPDPLGLDDNHPTTDKHATRLSQS